jgi:hypothetical protein
MRSRSIAPQTWFFASIVSLIVVLFAFAAPAEPQVAADLRTGYHADAEEGIIGGGINSELGGRWDFNPNLEWVLVDGYDLWSVNADFHRDFGTSGPALWLGGGPALIVTDVGPVSDEDLGLNLLGGVGARYGSVRPYAQMKVTLADNSSSALLLGFRF